MKATGLKALIFVVIVSLLCCWTPAPVKATTTWQQVGGNGLGDADNYLLPTMEVWNGYIYAGVGRLATSARIYRSSNGTSWESVEDDFGHAGLGTLVDLHPFDGRLYASVGSEAIPTTAEIWRSDVDGDTWTQFGTDGLGDALNTEFMQMEEFNGMLYVGSRNAGGGQLFRTDGAMGWDEITNDGFSDVENEAIWGLKSWGGYIWAGTLNDTGAQIWRSTTGDVGDWIKYYDYQTEGAPEFTVVNLLDDFKDHFYWSAGSDAGFEIALRESDVLHFYTTGGMGDANNIRLSENATQVGDYVYFGTLNSPAWGGTGGELWISEDGLTATQVGEDGFGDANNYALYAIAFNKYLYIGFSNGDTGLQIYRRLSTSGFSIKNNDLPDGAQGQGYNTGIKAIFGEGDISFIITKGSLPPGLSLDEATGAITGTPTEAGEFNFTIQARDEEDHDNQDFSIKIIAGVATSNVTVLPQTGANL